MPNQLPIGLQNQLHDRKPKLSAKRRKSIRSEKRREIKRTASYARAFSLKKMKEYADEKKARVREN
jgi:hypothetical protein